MPKGPLRAASTGAAPPGERPGRVPATSGAPGLVAGDRAGPRRDLLRPRVRPGPGATGLRGFWMGYFAARAAPIGPVGPAPVAATFFNFHPAMVRRSLPDALVVRRSDQRVGRPAEWGGRGARTTRSLGGGPGPVPGPAAGPGGGGGRRIGPGAVQRQPGARRGGSAGRGVVASLYLSAGTPRGRPRCRVDGGRSGRLRGAGPLRPVRGPPPPCSWTAGAGRPASGTRRGTVWPIAGWSAVAGSRRPDSSLRQSVEETTDRLAAPPFAALDEEEAAVTYQQLAAVAAAVAAAGAIPFPNPMGLPAPDRD